MPGQVEEILMIVKTYPTPSKTFGEVVCTAGIRLRDMAWVRLYPYPFRQAERDFQFQSWQRIQARIEKTDNRDRRPESYKLVDVSTIRHLGKPIDPENGTWKTRMPYIYATEVPSVKTLLDAIPEKGNDEWGPSIRPVRIQPGAKLTAELKKDEDWTEEEKASLAKAKYNAENSLFTSYAPDTFKTLKKIPYQFRLTFKDMTDTEYSFIILDWGLAVLYLRFAADPADAIEKVRHKMEVQICGPDKETYLILGNMNHEFKRKQLAIVGMVHPKLSKEKMHLQAGGLF